MRVLGRYFRAFAQGYTYDVRRNNCLWLGFFTALMVTLFPITPGSDFPVILVLAQSLFFSLVFGALGTLKRDLTLRNQALIRRLTGLAMTDPLTGLYNRRYVTEELKNLLFRAHRSGEPVTVVFFDLDDFKGVNGKEGHRGGDVMLVSVAEALRGVLRRGEILARYGGDEFVLVVPSDLPYARDLVDRAVEAVRERTHLSLSAGVATAPPDGGTPEALIAAAASLVLTKSAHHQKRIMALQ